MREKINLQYKDDIGYKSDIVEQYSVCRCVIMAI